jgi:hypothetical protein
MTDIPYRTALIVGAGPGISASDATAFLRRCDLNFADVGAGAMFSKQDVQQAIERGANFKPAILSARYHGDTDRVELETPWCILIADRQRIEELRALSQTDMESIIVSAVGLHVEKADVDINSACLITSISRQLEK